MHHDGNALAINDLIKQQITLSTLRKECKPGAELAALFKCLHAQRKASAVVSVPHLLSAYTVVRYRYLHEYGAVMGLDLNDNVNVLPVAVPPPRAFQQSLPWAGVVETGGFGHAVWYSKDVMPWPGGHVECIALATVWAIADKSAVLQEVTAYIQ